MKELSEMTLEELWELFPIILKEHNPEYQDWYEIEKQDLLEQFGSAIKRINHIGSTAVEGLLAKPTVDILMEFTPDYDITQLQAILQAHGWILMNTQTSPEFRQIYNKGYTKYGFAQKVYHLHIRYFNDWNELYFRDYLEEHPQTAEEYAKLKRELARQFEHDRDAYTDGKGEFIQKVTSLAREEYGNGY